MSKMSCEQENHILDQINGRQMINKLQTSEMNRSLKKAIITPKVNALKPLEKSSRKAFGNVSNVLHSGTQPSIGGKHHNKIKSLIKETESTDLLDQMRPLTTNAVTDTESKFLEDIEEMNIPSKEDMVSDETDPITKGLFEMEERLVLEMAFDSDFEDSLFPKIRNIELNDLF